MTEARINDPEKLAVVVRDFMETLIAKERARMFGNPPQSEPVAAQPEMRGCDNSSGLPRLDVPQMTELKTAKCWYCDGDNVDHKHGSGSSCGDCCGMHGSLAHSEPDAYKWVKDCICAKNERIDRAETALAAANERIAGFEKYSDQLTEMLDKALKDGTALRRENEQLKSSMEGN